MIERNWYHLRLFFYEICNSGSCGNYVIAVIDVMISHRYLLLLAIVKVIRVAVPIINASKIVVVFCNAIVVGSGSSNVFCIVVVNGGRRIETVG